MAKPWIRLQMDGFSGAIARFEYKETGAS